MTIDNQAINDRNLVNIGVNAWTPVVHHCQNSEKIGRCLIEF